ncbi:hypothetical protein NDU88_005130 [Pleurodeles waltl]|uniref:Uncharacterized protein n=1 Tax=Pleurodeles waltl TaxID=8319 RepID=A0AAV7TT70_PLEWA|nr:hypothetical protein NDU88_005130 [Pleurodeles waltl]
MGAGPVGWALGGSGAEWIRRRSFTPVPRTVAPTPQPGPGRTQTGGLWAFETPLRVAPLRTGRSPKTTADSG